MLPCLADVFFKFDVSLIKHRSAKHGPNIKNLKINNLQYLTFISARYISKISNLGYEIQP
ncbi:hypothetical protein HYN43_004235 [Mucilaginibacter celer]|uniref:Uncharacterized protein n=1 Tax=Mucilaginibacter celer TaxID=2305508 RepID=A0A494VT75_9SPHI|nr:hypothetical protein HYN43_004235 [Mucilaginibacter celer]